MQGKHETNAPLSTVKRARMEMGKLVKHSKQSLDGRRGQAETTVLKLSRANPMLEASLTT